MTTTPSFRFGSRRRCRHGERGTSLIELMMAMSIMAIALMGHLSSTLSTSRYSGMTRSRSDALRIAEQFVEQLRSDDDWPSLYSRLAAAQDYSQPGSGVVSTAHTGPTFNDGSRALPVTAYISDFVEPESMDAVGVVVEVPGTTGDPSAPPVLLESTVAEQFGLPFDLNGDGVMDNDPRNGDNIALPVVVRFRFLLDGVLPYELSLATWIRGAR